MFLLVGTGIYLLATVLIGLWASTRVKDSEDFLRGGRSFTLPLTTASLFATWFGAETVLGSSAEVANEGLIGMVEDPLGAALCLLLLGLFLARPLHRMNLTTFADFYRHHYGPLAEHVAGFFLIISYLGWIAGQFVALGVLSQAMLGMTGILSDEMLRQAPVWGIAIGAAVVLAHIYWGGLWSVSVLDLVQNTVIVLGLLAAVGQLVHHFGWHIPTERLPDGFFRMAPASGSSPISWWNYLAAWITVGLGSLPQQDVFQRVNAAKTEKVAVYGSLLAALLYLTVGMLPILIALYVRAYEPNLAGGDGQALVLNFILRYTHPWVQLLFFGALLSAIMNCAGGAILAPAAVLSENWLARAFRTDEPKRKLWLSRMAVLVITALSLVLASWRGNIHELVAESSALSLVSLFVPMITGIWLPGVRSWAAIAAMVGGMLVWLACMVAQHHAGPEATGWVSVNPLIYGLAASFAPVLLDQLDQRFRRVTA